MRKSGFSPLILTPLLGEESDAAEGKQSALLRLCFERAQVGSVPP